MPLIRVSMFPGRTHEQKAELVARLTDTFLDVCGRPGQSRDGVWVILEEVVQSNWATGGQLGRQDDGRTRGSEGVSRNVGKDRG